MKRLSPHVNPIPNYVPALDAVLHFVERDDPNGHWFVRDGKRPPRRHNHRGHAFLKLRTRASAATRFRDRGEYCVARLLIELTRPPFPVRTGFDNSCGLSQCVNPDHWTPQLASAPKWRFAIASDTWQLVAVRTGKPANKPIVLRARDQAGVVHVLSVDGAPGRLPDVLPAALCGQTFYPFDLVVLEADVTCTKGC